jgi:ABC-type antimicrobial peptide transport system permease subunit
VTSAAVVGQGGGPSPKLDVEIIGVVADSLYEGPREGVRRQVFIPSWVAGTATIYVRTTMGSSAAFSLIRREVPAVDRSLPVFETKTVQAQLDETLLSDRLVALLSAGFGLLATLLASIGLYGVMAFVVARRRKEVGIRIALGAQRPAILWSVMQEVLILLAMGLAIGIPTGLGLGKFVSAQLYGIQGDDPSVAIGTMLLLTVVSALAGFIPAHRASRVDPILALRYE